MDQSTEYGVSMSHKIDEVIEIKNAKEYITLDLGENWNKV